MTCRTLMADVVTSYTSNSAVWSVVNMLLGYAENLLCALHEKVERHKKKKVHLLAFCFKLSKAGIHILKI